MTEVLQLYRAAWLSRRGGAAWLGGQMVAGLLAIILGIPHPYFLLGLLLVYAVYHAALQAFLLLKHAPPGEEAIQSFEQVRLDLFLSNACRLLSVLGFGSATITIWLIVYLLSQMS